MVQSVKNGKNWHDIIIGYPQDIFLDSKTQRV
jgi:hypothetical protein